jgi:hypothetical protein
MPFANARSAPTRTAIFAAAISVLTLSACQKKAEPHEIPASSAAPATAASPTLPPRTAANDPFRWGYCELSVDGGPPTRNPGGGYNVASRHWAAPGPQRERVEPLIINCGKVNLSTATSVLADYPMKPGRHVIAPGSAKPGTFVPIPGGKGELVIDAWDKAGIRGSFMLAGSDGKSSVGKFDLKCPPTLACQ